MNRQALNAKNSFILAGDDISEDFFWHYHLLNLAGLVESSWDFCEAHASIFQLPIWKHYTKLKYWCSIKLHYYPLDRWPQHHQKLKSFNLLNQLEKIAKLWHPINTLSSLVHLEQRLILIVPLYQEHPDYGISGHHALSSKSPIYKSSSPEIINFFFHPRNSPRYSTYLELYLSGFYL